MSKKITNKIKKIVENHKDEFCDVVQAAIHSLGGENSKEMALAVVDAMVNYGMESQEVINDVERKGFSEFSKIACKFFDYMKKIDNNNNKVFFEIIKNSEFSEERQNELIYKYEEFIDVKDNSFCRICKSITKTAGTIIGIIGVAVDIGYFFSKLPEIMEPYSKMKQVKYTQRGKTARTIAKQQGKTARKAL